MDSQVARYRRKPVPAEPKEMTVAKYVPGQPLTALAEVARMADDGAELAEVQLPSGPVLLVGWTWRDDHYGDRHQEWEVVQEGEYLTCGRRGDHLCTSDDEDLAAHYDLVTD